jgi:hypothetical protein
MLNFDEIFIIVGVSYFKILYKFMFFIFSSKITEKDLFISCIPNIEVEFELKGLHTVSVIEQQNI